MVKLFLITIENINTQTVRIVTQDEERNQHILYVENIPWIIYLVPKYFIDEDMIASVRSLVSKNGLCWFDLVLKSVERRFIDIYTNKLSDSQTVLKIKYSRRYESLDFLMSDPYVKYMYGHQTTILEQLIIPSPTSRFELLDYESNI